MARRRKMSRHKSKKLFRKTAQKTHKKNFQGSNRAMRGGIRL